MEPVKKGCSVRMFWAETSIRLTEVLNSARGTYSARTQPLVGQAPLCPSPVG